MLKNERVFLCLQYRNHSKTKATNNNSWIKIITTIITITIVIAPLFTAYEALSKKPAERYVSFISSKTTGSMLKNERVFLCLQYRNHSKTKATNNNSWIKIITTIITITIVIAPLFTAYEDYEFPPGQGKAA
ncbi:hypothetical protein TREES_T100005016 [Tupaia chinensis]|uniref:Uncharacterized protein n=1 Tax=Tupaia chinensis TaxID=246437 RepID=L9L4V1_TUPCH|nr:hypothetical protein TREES_T100005016 [Tupaia chinensis]